jgi:hypothetical protein
MMAVVEADRVSTFRVSVQPASGASPTAPARAATALQPNLSDPRRHDVHEGWTTHTHAETVYGVAITDNSHIDMKKTERHRLAAVGGGRG